MLTNERQLTSVDCTTRCVGLVRNTQNARDMSSAYSNIPATLGPQRKLAYVQGSEADLSNVCLFTLGCLACADHLSLAISVQDLICMTGVYV